MAAFVAAYAWHLWPEWVHNPDLSHGFFTPLIFALLLLEGRDHGTRRWLSGSRQIVLQVGALGSAVLLFVLAGLLAASVGWSHSLVDFVLAASLVCLLLGGLFALADARWRFLPVNGNSLTAVGLWLLSSPLPSGTYARVTVLLQGWVTANVIGALHLVGVPAQQQGNLIELASTTVGVAEACSGIRSLLSCIYAGFFFAAWQVRSPGKRAVLILAAPLLAILMNFIRSLILTLMANAGRDITGFWHDATGFAILAVTAALLAWLAMSLGRDPAEKKAAATAAAPTGVPAAARLAAGGCLVIVALAVFFAAYGPSGGKTRSAAAPVESLLPETPADWQVSTARDLYQFSDILRTDELVQRTYYRMLDGQPCQLTVYVAHWNPGQAPVSLVASHTPDACWPGAGWIPQVNAATRTTLAIDGRQLPAGEQRVFLGQSGRAQNVWFWHVYDGRVISYQDPYSVPALLSLALRYGFRREGDQYFIRVSCNRPWEQLAREPLVRQIFSNLARTGLSR